MFLHFPLFEIRKLKSELLEPLDVFFPDKTSQAARDRLVSISGYLKCVEDFFWLCEKFSTFKQVFGFPKRRKSRLIRMPFTCFLFLSFFIEHERGSLPKRSLLLSFFWFSLDFLWSPLHFSGLPHAHQSFRDFLVPRSLSPTKILPKDSLLILCFFLWKAREPSETF